MRRNPTPTDDEDMNHTRLIPSLLLGSTLVAGLAVTATPAAAGGGSGGFPPVINCLQHVCTLLHDDARDSDGDGFTDADEQAFGSDPYDARSCPPVRWIFASIADETLPGVWIEPQLDLLTISPDGHAITVDITTALGSLGLPLPKRASDFDPAAMSPAGIDLGTLGVTLDWQVHGVATSTSPLPPDAPNPSLYGFTGAPPREMHVPLENGDIYVQNGFEYGEFTSSVQIYNSEGKLMGAANASGTDPWKTQAAAMDKATAKATEEAKAALAAAVEAEARRLAAEADKREADEAARAKAEKEAREKAEKERKEREAKEKAEEEKKKKKGGLQDPDAGTPIDPRFLTPEQIAAAIAAGSGSYFTNVGDTGVIALVTPGDYVDPTTFIIHLDPEADPFVASDTPVIGGQAGPDYDPNLPQGPVTGGTLPSGGTNS